MTKPDSYKLYNDIAHALLRSGLSEAYIVAGGNFQHSGPFEVGQVLDNYESQVPGSVIESVSRYTRPGETHTNLLSHGQTFHFECDGVVFEVDVAEIGENKMRFLYSRIDALALVRGLTRRVEQLERKIERLG